MPSLNDYMRMFIAFVQALIPIIGFIACILLMLVLLVIAIALPVSLVLKVVDNVTTKGSHKE